MTKGIGRPFASLLDECMAFFPRQSVSSETTTFSHFMFSEMHGCIEFNLPSVGIRNVRSFDSKSAAPICCNILSG